MCLMIILKSMNHNTERIGDVMLPYTELTPTDWVVLASISIFVGLWIFLIALIIIETPRKKYLQTEYPDTKGIVKPSLSRDYYVITSDNRGYRVRLKRTNRKFSHTEHELDTETKWSIISKHLQKY